MKDVSLGRVVVYRVVDQVGIEVEEHKGLDFDFEVREGGALYVGPRVYDRVEGWVAYAPGHWAKVTVDSDVDESESEP